MAYPKLKATIVSNVRSVKRSELQLTWLGSDGHSSVYSKDWLALSGQKVKPRSVERLGLVEYV
jgi:hypothetical protein